jgi:hypothetical protein
MNRAIWLAADEAGFSRIDNGQYAISVAKTGILSRDLGILWSGWDFFFFYFEKSISGFFFDFLEREVQSLEIDFLVKLTRNKQFC